MIITKDGAKKIYRQALVRAEELKKEEVTKELGNIFHEIRLMAELGHDHFRYELPNTFTDYQKKLTIDRLKGLGFGIDYQFEGCNIIKILWGF